MPDHLLPDDWLSELSRTGCFACNLAERLGGLERVTDEVLLDVASGLAALVPGLSCGRVMHIREEPGSRYAALTTGAVPYHNDHLYFYKLPQFLLLFCDSPADEGGDTLIVRGDEALRTMSPGLRERLAGLRVRVRMGDCQVTRSLIATHPIDGAPVLLFADTASDDVCILEVGGRPMEGELLEALRSLLASLDARRHRWRAGDLLLIDNLRTMHARTAYAGPRRLRRVSVGPHAARQ